MHPIILHSLQGRSIRNVDCVLWKFRLSSTTDPKIYAAMKKDDEKTFVIVDAWGGRGPYKYNASGNLQAAETAGITDRAAFCYLNYDNKGIIPGAPIGTDQTGKIQVDYAFGNVGVFAKPGKNQIAFMAIDVEDGYLGNPQVMTADDRVRRIADAIQEVRNKGVPAVLYTARLYWKTVMGSSMEISGVPLWDATEYGAPPAWPTDAPALDQFPGWGTWHQRLGAQYSGDESLQGITVNLDDFRPDAFSLPRPTGTPTVTVSLGKPQLSGTTATVPIKLTNSGSSDALACRITRVIMPGGFTLSTPLPVKLNTIAAGSSAVGTLQFAHAKSGTYKLTISGTYGGGTFQITLTMTF